MPLENANCVRPDATLEQLLTLYSEGRPLSLYMRQVFARSIRSYSKHLRRPALASDLCPERIKVWLTSLRRRLSAITVRNYKEATSCLWRALFRAQLIDHGPPERPIKPRLPKQERYPRPAFWRRLGSADKSRRLSPDMLLADYHASVYIPAKIAQGISGRALDHAKTAIRWLSAFLKRDATLCDLNDANLSSLIEFIVSHGRLESTGRGVVERLLSLWRFAVWNGHLLSGSTTPKVALLIKNRPRVPKLRPATLSERQPPSKVPAALEQSDGAKAATVKPAFVPAQPATTETTLENFLLKHYVPSHDLVKRTIETLVNAVVRFSRYLGRPAQIADLTAEKVNAWLADALEREILSRETVHGHRNMVLTLWRWAYEMGVVQEYPRRVRPIKRPRRHIEGYDSSQMKVLLAAAHNLVGAFRVTRIEKRLFWRAYLLVAWYTGLRVSDVLGITKDRITSQPDGSGLITIIMQKTGDAIHRRLPADAMEAVQRCIASGLPRSLVFALWGGRGGFYRDFRNIARATGHAGTLRWIRRGSASEIEAIHPGGGRAHLGHRSPNLFDTNYRVDRIVKVKVHLPPALGATGGVA